MGSPKPAASVGSAAGCPKESGQYRTGGDVAPSEARIRRPASRFRMSDSPDGMSSSASTYQGPASSAPSCSSLAMASRFSGRTSR
jgi:hypothetical protein